MKFSERNENRMRELVELRAIRDALARENTALRTEASEALQESEKLRALAVKAMGWLEDNAKCSDNCTICIAYSEAGAEELRHALSKGE